MHSHDEFMSYLTMETIGCKGTAVPIEGLCNQGERREYGVVTRRPGK